MTSWQRKAVALSAAFWWGTTGTNSCFRWGTRTTRTGSGNGLSFRRWATTKCYNKTLGWYNTDFHLSPSCFGTDMIQKCTQWSQMRVHRLKFGQVFAKFQCASFLVQKILQTRKRCIKCWNIIKNRKTNIYFEIVHLSDINQFNFACFNVDQYKIYYVWYSIN